MKTKSIISISAAFVVFMFGAIATNVGATRPKGLEERGPLEKRTFIHYSNARSNAKPPWAGGTKPGNNDPVCYSTFGNGIAWKTDLGNYYVNATGSGLLEQDVLAATDIAVSEWDQYTGFSLGGNAIADTSANWDDSVDQIDGRNEISFGFYNDPGVIAVTTTWGYFSGPPRSREIVEFDILFNTSYSWGTDGSVDLMDYQNIATHELGHGFGLEDIYDTACSTVTMYGYSTEGDLSARDLEQADISGIQEIYGN